MTRSLLGVLLLAAFSAACNAEDETRPDVKSSIIVHSVKPEQGSVGIARYGITRRDYSQLSESIPNLTRLLPTRRVESKASVGDRACQSTVIGTTADYPRFHEMKVTAGRFVSEFDLQQNNNVAVLGSKVAQDLFKEADAIIGDAVRIGDNFYTVIGTIADQNDSEKTNSWISKSVIIPITTMRVRMGDTSLIIRAGTVEAERYEISQLDIALEGSREQIQQTAATISAILRKNHEFDDYQIEVKK